MLEKVKETIKKYNMISKGETVLCCLSGGADSVTLILCLRELGYKLYACHINHHLRGEESDRDEKFCIDLCNRLSVPLKVVSVDVRDYCKRKSCSIEEGARVLRYEAFSKIKADKTATAHTLSDSIETVLFNLTRGTGLKGMCGVPPVRDNIIRPLINCSRKEIEQFLSERKQSYVTDSTNMINDCSRNKIRNIVIPVLREINPQLDKTFYNTKDNFISENEFLDELAEKLIKDSECETGYNLECLRKSHDCVLKRAIVDILKKDNISYNADRIVKISDIIRNGGKINLSSDIYAVASSGVFRITKLYKHEDLVNEFIIGKELRFGEKIINAKVIDNFDIQKHKKCAVDYEKIVGSLIIRNRQNGDTIRFAGRNHTTKIKKLFSEFIPQEKRDNICLIADREGLIFVEGFGIAQRVQPDKDSKKIIIFEIS